MSEKIVNIQVCFVEMLYFGQKYSFGQKKSFLVL